MITPEDWLVLPVKSFSDAKTRLASALAPSRRKLLAKAMLEDVLDAASEVKPLCNIAIATSSREVVEFAHGRCTAVIDDAGAIGTNAAVKAALAQLSSQGANAVAVLPSDIPLIHAGDIFDLLAGAKRSGVALAPASIDNGTNGFAMASPALMPPCFGPDSFTRHLEAARAIGINAKIIDNGRFGLDLDDPARLHVFRSIGSNTRSEWLLRGFDEDDAAAEFSHASYVSASVRTAQVA